MSRAPKAWYVNKFQHGEYKHTKRVPGTFDEVDKFVAGCNRVYAQYGWTYEITDSPIYRREFVEIGAGI